MYNSKLQFFYAFYKNNYFYDCQFQLLFFKFFNNKFKLHFLKYIINLMVKYFMTRGYTREYKLKQISTHKFEMIKLK